MRRIVLLGLLFAAHLLFLWMFLASGGFERMARNIPEALNFSADWRHGMTSGCPIYMPGYFLLSVTTWIWSGARRLKILLLEGAAVLSLAWGTAELLAPLGTSMLAEAFERRTGIAFDGPLLDFPIVGSVRGLFTLIFWSALIAGGRSCLVKRSWKPLLPPALLGSALALIRPVSSLDHLSSFWIQKVAQGDVTAVGSLLLIFAAGGLLVRRGGAS